MAAPVEILGEVYAADLLAHLCSAAERAKREWPKEREKKGDGVVTLVGGPRVNEARDARGRKGRRGYQGREERGQSVGRVAATNDSYFASQMLSGFVDNGEGCDGKT